MSPSRSQRGNSPDGRRGNSPDSKRGHSPDSRRGDSRNTRRADSENTDDKQNSPKSKFATHLGADLFANKPKHEQRPPSHNNDDLADLDRTNISFNVNRKEILGSSESEASYKPVEEPSWHSIETIIDKVHKKTSSKQLTIPKSYIAKGLDLKI